MVVGKSPGEKDAREGIPFSFDSGNMLERMLNSIGLDWKQDVSLINPVFCPAVNDANPTMGEMKSCAVLFGEMVRTVKPKVFLALGNTAYQGLSGENKTMMELAGKDIPFKSMYTDENGSKIPIWVIYHPAYLLRLRGQKEKLNFVRNECWYTLRTMKEYLDKHV